MWVCCQAVTSVSVSSVSLLPGCQWCGLVARLSLVSVVWACCKAVNVSSVGLLPGCQCHCCGLVARLSMSAVWVCCQAVSVIVVGLLPGLLDPKWMEERQRSMAEKQEQEEVLAAGSDIDVSLKQLAERRTDIFGIGTEETQIGKKVSAFFCSPSTTTRGFKKASLSLFLSVSLSISVSLHLSLQEKITG